MGIAIYDVARVGFASKLIDWAADAMRCSIPKLGYVPSLGGDTVVSGLGPLRGTTEILNRSVTSTGWLKCDPILIAAVPINETIDRVTIYRLSDELLLFDISFPAINSPQALPLNLIQDLTSPGLCRL